jgi:hypothetical protein
MYLQCPRPLPKLYPGVLPASYIQLGEGRGESGVLVRDPEVEAVENKSSQQSNISPPLPPPELTKAGKPLTKKEKKEVCLSCFSNLLNDDFDLPLSSRDRP